MNKAPASLTLCSSSLRQSKRVARHQAEIARRQNNDIAVEGDGLSCASILFCFSTRCTFASFSKKNERSERRRLGQKSPIESGLILIEP
jgi:hypothetical protein